MVRFRAGPGEPTWPADSRWALPTSCRPSASSKPSPTAARARRARSRLSEADAHFADDERPVVDVDSVVMAVPVPLTLEVEAIERPAAVDLEADVAQVESNARGEPLLIIENLVVLVVSVGAVVLVMVPVEARVGPQRAGRSARSRARAPS